MKERILFIFPGHGSQCVGMCRDIYKNFFEARYAFEEVSSILNTNVYKLCCQSSKDVLDVPQNASLAVFAYSLAVSRVLEGEFDRSLASMSYAMVGYMMGQYSALHCAGSIGLRDTLKILNEPGHYKYICGSKDVGMVAVVGIQKKQLRQLLALTNGYGYAEIASHNVGKHYVVTGQKTALGIVMDNARARGATLVKDLNIGLPANCMLMSPAADKLADSLQGINVSKPKTRFFSCQYADFIETPRDIKNELTNQMTHGVQWFDVMNKFPQHAVTHVYELGPSQILTKMVNRANLHCNAMHTNSLVHLKAVIKSLESVIGSR